MTPETRLELMLKEVGRTPTAQDFREIAALRKIEGIGDNDSLWRYHIGAAFDRAMMRAETGKVEKLLKTSVDKATGGLEPAIQAAVDRIATSVLARHKWRWSIATMVVGAVTAAAIFLTGSWYGSDLAAAVAHGRLRIEDLNTSLGAAFCVTALIVFLLCLSVYTHYIEGTARKTLMTTAAAILILVLYLFHTDTATKQTGNATLPAQGYYGTNNGFGTSDAFAR